MDTLDNIIKNRPPSITYGNGKSKIYVCTFNEIYEFSSVLHLPEIQGDLNQDKIDEMIDSYKNKHHYMGSKALLTITKISIADKVQYCLVDGQHRLEMIKQIYEENNVSDSILVTIINIESKEELADLFLEINNDSSKCIYKNLTIFDKQIYEDLKKKINDDVSLIPLKKSDCRKDIYTTSQFVSHLIYYQIIEKVREKYLLENSADSFLNFLKVKEKEFFNLFKYDSKKLDKEKFNTEEKKQIDAKSCMFIKNNNFLDWILDPELEPDHDFNKRPPITTKLKKEVWKKYYEDKGKNTSDLCPIVGCSSIMIEKEHETWHCGHITSHKNKGLTEVGNLRPICPHCNRKMNYRNWDEWVEEHIKKLIDTKYFNNLKKIDCCNEKCKNEITKKTYKAQKYQDNSVKPWCKKCYNNFNGIEEEEIVIINEEKKEEGTNKLIKKIKKFTINSDPSLKKPSKSSQISNSNA